MNVRRLLPRRETGSLTAGIMKRLSITITVVLCLLCCHRVRAVDMRRPIGPQRPMWLVHVSSLDGESVVQTIDNLPEEIKPYVVLNLAMNVNADPALLDQMLGQCKTKGVWCMIQPSSGYNNYLDYADVAAYEDYYRNYPNLIGYNFCEQIWGFTADTFTERLELYCKLLEIASKYGGYLYINDTQSISNRAFNTLSKLKTYERYAACVRRYGQHLIYGDKTTTGYGYYDNESACFGMFLRGYAGHYAIRFDQFGWSYSGRARLFGEEYSWQVPNALAWFTCPEAVAGIAVAEHLLMSGATVIDGPEISTILVMRYGRLTPGGTNVMTDLLRKVIDGTVRIPSLEEVRARIKAAYVCNNTNNVEDELYAGLYAMDGNKTNNRTWLKRSGRYLTIPTFADLPDELEHIEVVVTQDGEQSYATRWATTEDKTTELNQLYPQVHTGTLFVGRTGSRLLAYNPHLNTDSTTQAGIPLIYNSCDSLSLAFTPHTFAVVSERTDGLDLYLNNYRTDKDYLWDLYPSVSDSDGLASMAYFDPLDYLESYFIDNPTDDSLRRSVVTVAGCAAEPSYAWNDRGSHDASSVSAAYDNGTFTLTVMHNGPLDLSISCAGHNTDRPETPEYDPIEDIPQPNLQTGTTRAELIYDFEEMEEGSLTASSQPWIAADGAGGAQITYYNGSLMLNPTGIGSGTNRVGVANLTCFGAEQDYAVTWKECVTGTSKGGVLMRGKPTSGGGNPGLMDGYYFQVLTDLSGGTTTLAIRKVTNLSDGTTRFDNGTSGEVSIPAPEAGAPRWYRATCSNNLLTLEYSDDGQSFTRALARTDARYSEAGITQLLWGVGVPTVTSSYYDDISLTYLSEMASMPATGVQTGTVQESTDDAWYTLLGVRIPRPTAPGVYIHGKRKYIVK